jgi:YgiT-type zinc finger domain-containing protein
MRRWLTWRKLAAWAVLARHRADAFHVLFAADIEKEAMRCTTCGSELTTTQTDLPLKVQETSIVILKSLPVLQCKNCPEYLIEDEVLSRVDQILGGVPTGTEVEIIRYAA